MITPLYNKASYIEATVGSVLAQTCTDWEWLIVDNNSTDGSVERVRRFGDPRIRLMHCAKQGPGAARNRGFDEACGEWILLLDADDLLEPSYLQKQLETAERHPDASLAASAWCQFESEDPSRVKMVEPAGLRMSPQALKDYSIAFCPWAPHAAIFKRSLLSDREAYFSEELDAFAAEDLNFWFKILDRSEVVFGGYAGARYRYHVPQSRNPDQDIVKWFEALDRTVRLNLSYLSRHSRALSDDHREHLVRLYSGLYAQANRAGNKDVARLARCESGKWLREYLEHARKPKKSMRLRALFGPAIYSRAMAAFGR